jgi:hypothetical protein
MIPCPVCLVVLDGGGGRCEAHIDWTIGRVWLPGLWPSLEQIVQPQDPHLVARLYAEHRSSFRDLAYDQIRRARLPRYERPVFLGFRHYSDRFEVARDGFAQFAVGIVLPVLVHGQLLEHDQVEGIGHLFYAGAPNESPGPGPGLELLIAEGPKR